MNTYNSFDYWHNSQEKYKCGGENYKSNYIFQNFVKNLEIPKTGYCVQLGVHTGYTLELMKNYFGENRVKGIDLYNCNKDPCVYECDINTIDFDIPIAYAENDIGKVNIDPTSRLNGFKWAIKNLIPAGKLITTSNVANKYFKERVEDICLQYNCNWERLDKYKNTEWAKFIDTQTRWNVISMMLVTKSEG